MGCICSKAEDVFELPPTQTRAVPTGRFSSIISRGLSASASQHARSATPPQPPPSNVMPAQEVLQLAAEVSRKFFKGEADHVLVTALSLMESAGNKQFQHDPGDVGEPRLGLCQLTLSTARWLATQQGFSQFGTPEHKDLLDPERALYFCMAYLRFLLTWNGQERTEHFAVRAYKQGPKNVEGELAEDSPLWRRYLRAKQLLRRLDDGLREASAAAAAAAGNFWPIMHVVQPGETVAKIAQVCGISVDDVMSANPDLLDASNLQPNDCIALPVPNVLPRVYVVQPGDTLMGIAKAHDCSIMRLLQRNPELQEVREVQAGMVLGLPGLRGGNSSGSKMDSFLERDTRIMSSLHQHYHQQHLSSLPLPALSKSQSLVLEPSFAFHLSSLPRHRSSPLEAQSSSSPWDTPPPPPAPFVLPYV